MTVQGKLLLGLLTVGFKAHRKRGQERIMVKLQGQGTSDKFYFRERDFITF
jgi:hypothetical protein